MIKNASKVLCATLNMVKYAQKQSYENFINSWMNTYLNNPTKQQQYIDQFTLQPIVQKWLRYLYRLPASQSNIPKINEMLNGHKLKTIIDSFIKQGGTSDSFYDFLYSQISNKYKKIDTSSLDPSHEDYDPGYIDFNSPGNKNQSLLTITQRIHDLTEIDEPTSTEQSELKALSIWRDQMIKNLRLQGAKPVAPNHERSNNITTKDMLNNITEDIFNSYSGATEHYVNNVYDNDRFHAHGTIKGKFKQRKGQPIPAYDIVRPSISVQKKLTTALMNSLIKIKILYDNSLKPRGRSKADILNPDTNPTFRYTASGMRALLLQELTQQMNALNIDYKYQQQMLSRVNKVEDAELRSYLGNADEAMRFHTYEQGRLKHGSGKNWSELDPETLRKIQDESYQKLNYGPNGNNMWGRKTTLKNTIDSFHSPIKWNENFGTEHANDFIGQEINNHAQGKIGKLLGHTLPRDSGAWSTRDDNTSDKRINKINPGQQNEIIEAERCNKYLIRIAESSKLIKDDIDIFEKTGFYKEADSLVVIAQHALSLLSEILD